MAESTDERISISDDTFLLDGALLGKLLNVLPKDVPPLMREHAITSICERGIDAHRGEFRLSFFYKNRRARLNVDTSGHILRRSIIDFGKRPLPKSLHSSE
jgi:hypothetical protein